MATTCSPSSRSSESPTVAILICPMVSSEISESFTETTARSLFTSVPFMFADTVFWSINPTESFLAPSTTWLLVAIKSSESFFPTITPVPAPSTSYCWVPPKKFLISSTDMVEIVTTEGIAFFVTSITVSSVLSSVLLSAVSSLPLFAPCDSSFSTVAVFEILFSL